jgi:hypothetical protein
MSVQHIYEESENLCFILVCGSHISFCELSIFISFVSPPLPWGGGVSCPPLFCSITQIIGLTDFGQLVRRVEKYLYRLPFVPLFERRGITGKSALHCANTHQQLMGGRVNWSFYLFLQMEWYFGNTPLTLS